MIRRIVVLAVFLIASFSAQAGITGRFTAPQATTFIAPASFTVTSLMTPNLDGEYITLHQISRNGTVVTVGTGDTLSYNTGTLSAGTYTFTAYARSNKNATRTTTLTVTVTASSAPTVSLGPISGALVAPATLNIPANASDSDGSITQVEFYANGSLLYTDSTAPYAYTWAGVAAGSYAIIAKAYDNTGLTAVTPATSVTVGATAITGNIDDVRLVNGVYQILGWACSSGRNASIDVHLYVGGAAGAGTFATSTTANLASDAAVASACQASGTNYRFSIPLTAAMREQFANQKIYIHGISPEGGPNSLIGASGIFSVPAPLSLARRYIYDDDQRLCAAIEPETGATVTHYDAAGNVDWSASGVQGIGAYATCADARAAANASGRKVMRGYDGRNRLSALRFPDGRGDQDWLYTKDGLPAQITTYNGTGQADPVINSYVYNERRLLSGESQVQGSYNWSVGYGYDANGSRASTTYPAGLTVTYAPNALGQPTRVNDGIRNYASAISYYPNGAIRQFTYGTGVVHQMLQNARQLPARVVSSLGVLDYGYTYDENGNVTSIGDAARGSHYDRVMGYDALDRLAQAASPSFGGNGVHSFTYDALDNIRSWVLSGVKDYGNYIYDGNNRLLSIRNSAGPAIVGFDYDPQGNLSAKNGQAYQFDFGNRLRSAPNKESYRYDGLGRRTYAQAGSGAIYSLYANDGSLLWERDERSGKRVQHIYLAGSLIANRERPIAGDVETITYQHTDALGTPVAVTNASGTVTERTSYEPYGSAIGKPTYQGIGYTGHVMDGQTGLTYMQQRYYDPAIGRLLSIDPVTALDDGDMRHFNRYAYAYNNPYLFTDPDGRRSFLVSRRLDAPVAKHFANHNFIVHHAGNPGDPNATVRSFGITSDGSMGEVTPQTTGPNANTSAMDRAAWESIGVEGSGVTFREINASDEVVKSNADRVSAAFDYSYVPAVSGGFNSNTAAGAVAQESDGGAPRVDNGRMQPGTGQERIDVAREQVLLKPIGNK